MAASQEQKVDFLLKKIGYVQSKTGIAEDDSGISGTKKAPTEENKPSPLVTPSTNIWADSTFIPTSPPTSDTTYVKVYNATNAFQLTHDNTVTGYRTFIARSIFGNQSASISGDWVDPSFGSNYAVQVYKGDPNSGGVSLSPTGSGNSDEWFFDYSSGILNFNGTNVPSGITEINVYLVGYKYIGAKGVLPPAGRANFTSLNVTGLSTFASNVDLNANLDVDAHTDLGITNIRETLNVIGISTFGSDIDINASIDVDGHTELDDLNVSGVSTFASDIDINASIDVDGHTELDDVNVSTALTANNLIVTGSTLLSHSNSLKLQTTGIGISVSNGIGLTATITGPTNLIIDPGVVGDNTGIVRIKGDLFVDGTQTQINSTTIELADYIIGIATVATTDLLSDGAGIQIGPDNTFLYEFNTGINPSLKSSENLNVASGKVYQIEQIERLSADTLSLGTGSTIHSPASNALTFGTNGTEKVRITSDGDVGIGSVIPAGKLDVVGHTELDSVNVSGLSTFVSNVDLNADLDVDGRTELDTTNISETLNVVGIATFANNIDVNGDLDVDGHTELDDLNVSGVSTFASNVDLNASIDVNGHTELDNVNISGVTTIAGNIDANGDLDVDGRTELDITSISETLNVIGIATFANNIDVNGDLDVDGRTELDDLNVSGVSTFASDIDINASIDVDGRTELDITNISETLNVTGISTFENNVNVGGALSVTGNAFFVGMVTFAAGADGNITIGNANTDNVIFNADIDSSFIPDDTQTYDLGSSSQEWRNVFSKDIKVSTLTQNRVVFAGANGKLQTSGNLEFIDGSQLTVGTSLTVTGGLDVDGHTELDNVNISGVTTIAGALDAQDIIKGYKYTASGNGGTVTLAVTVELKYIEEHHRYHGLGSNYGYVIDGIQSPFLTLTPGRTYKFDQSHTSNSSHQIKFYLEADKTTLYEGDVTYNGTAGSAGAYTQIVVGDQTPVVLHYMCVNHAYMGNSIQVNSNVVNTNYDATLRGNLNVIGIATFANNIDANGDLDVDGRTELDITNISETLNVIGISTFASNVDLNASIDVDGHTELDDLNVSGVSTFASDIDINASIDVDGHTELDDLNVTGIVTFASNVDLNASIDVDGHTELDDLNVSGVSTFASNVDLNANLDVSGITTLGVTTTTDLEAQQLNVTGLSTFFSANIDKVIVRNQFVNQSGITEMIFDSFKIKATGSSLQGGAQTKAFFGNSTDNHSVKLYANGAEKLSTTLDGISVQGTVNANNGINISSGISTLGVTTTTDLEAQNLNVSGIGTFNNINVDGHTELDNVNISGVATATAFHTGALGSAIRVTSDTISGPAEIIIDPAGVGDNTGALRIKGDLFVDGTQTVINSTSIELADFIVGIATTATTDVLADGAGIQIGPNNTLLYDHTNTSLKSSENLNLTSNKTYKIDGTDVLSATTLGSAVVNSSLTSLGTIATGVWQGTAINDDYIDTIDNANKVSISALNIDGGTDIGALLADGDLIIVDDGAGGTNRKADVVGITTYTFSKVSGDVVISASGAATIQANSVALATDTTGDFVQSISGTTNEVTVSVTSGENVQPQIGLPDDVIVTNSLRVGTGIAAQGGIITATTFVGNGDFVDIDVDGHTELDDLKVTGVSTFTEEIDANGRIVGAATSNVIPFLYSNLSDLPSASTYHGAFAHVHATGKGYYAHAANWIELVNKETTGITGTGVENYNVGVVTATTFDGDINLDNNNITGNGSVNITGIITTTNTLHVGTGGTVISANADTGTFAIGSATTSITATMNGGAIPSIGLVIALGG